MLILRVCARYEEVWATKLKQLEMYKKAMKLLLPGVLLLLLFIMGKGADPKERKPFFCITETIINRAERPFFYRKIRKLIHLLILIEKV